MILLEFNELTPTLLDHFFAQGKLPNFRRFYDESSVYVTDAEEPPPLLNPWVQWVTVHTGLSAADHGLARLDQGHLLDKPRVWDLASRAGMRAFVCGSMNVGHDRDFNGYVLPDPWSTLVRPYPEGEGLEDFYGFVQAQVQEHTNEDAPDDRHGRARFLRFMLSHGLSAHTVNATLGQLAKERVGAAGRWKRAVLLDRMTFDVFRWIYRRHHPHFSTFFLNSTAHMQHAYWRHMDPEPFTIKPTVEDQDEYGEAVLFGYEQMDALLARIMRLAGDDATLVFATALGQQPCLAYEQDGGKRFYRPRSFEAFTEYLGLEGQHACSPVMSEQFKLTFSEEADADSAIAKLEALSIDGGPVLYVNRESAKSVFTGCRIVDQVQEGAMMSSVTGEQIGFYEIFYAADTVKSGMHHPDGALWIRTPSRTHRSFEGRVSLRSVAPTLVQMLGLEAPGFMTEAALAVEGAAVAA